MKIDAQHLKTSDSVRKLQSSLQAKAKTEPSYRFYSLWDKVCRGDFLVEAYQRCRRNGGSAGVDAETFERIELAGREAWLGKLQEELRTKQYRAQPLLRVWIPKSNGGQRPLGIPTVRDRVVQMAMVMVLGPIFEADLCDEQMGFRPGRDAKTAVRLVYYQVRQKGRQEVVDADLSDYFNTVPHGALMKSLSRRIADGQVLSVIARWLKAPVEERTSDGRMVRSTPAKDTPLSLFDGSIQSQKKTPTMGWSPEPLFVGPESKSAGGGGCHRMNKRVRRGGCDLFVSDMKSTAHVNGVVRERVLGCRFARELA